MKKPLLFITFLITYYTASAQTYAEKATEIQQMIWGAPAPEFQLKDVPAKYANESAVVLAQSYSKQRSTNVKFKFAFLFSSFANKITKLSIFHERVKVNDKSALENYSSLEYQKRLDRSVSMLIGKYNKLREAYVGVKIIKPDGQEVAVNTSEEVLTQNTNKDQKGKLAIPGLQVGDILDYYIATNKVDETTSEDSYRDNDQVFVLAGEYPILNYSLNFQFNKKALVHYISANDAPKFEESTLDNGDKVYKLTLKDLPKFQAQKWTSVYRQVPYIEISDSNGYQMYNKAGLEGNKDMFKTFFDDGANPYSTWPEGMLMDYYHGRKNLMAAPLDSSMKVYYDIWKYGMFGSYGKGDLDDLSQLNYRIAASKYATINMSRLLMRLEIGHEILLVCSRESNSLDNVFNMVDFDTMIKIFDGKKVHYMSFYDGVTHFDEIPSKYQGEKYISLTPERRNGHRYLFLESSGVLPVISANDNQIEETIQASLLADMQKVSVQRRVKQTGYLRHEGQRALLSAIDIDQALQSLAKGDPLLKRLASSDAKKSKEAFLAAMTKTDAELRKAFMDEAQGQFDQEPSAISDFKVISKALEVGQPVFEYTSTVVLNNFVKKAGNGYIIDAGKLAGSFVQLEEKDRKRTVDVYMPGARTFKYNIAITIPEGFKAVGLEELNKSKSNKTGSFTSTTQVKGNTLVITATRTYNNNFEKAADWPLVTEIVDTAFAFNNQKILLEK